VDVITIFSLFGITIFVGFAGEWIFEKTTIPDVIWLIILGFAVGQALHISGNPLIQQIGPIFTTFALVFILFEGVLNIDLKEVFAGVVEGSELAVVSFTLAILFSGITMLALGWGILESLVMGAILGDSAQAVIIPLIKKIHTKKAGLILTFESAISDVLCIVGALAFINIFVLNTFSINMVLQKILYSFVLAVFVGVGFAFFWVRVHRIMDRFSKSYMTTIAALLLVYSFVEWIGANGALACLSFGIVVGSSKKLFSLFDKKDAYSLTPSAKFFFAEISFFVKTLFFVYLGMIIDVSDMRLIAIGVFLALLLFAVRALAVRLSSKRLELDRREVTYLEILNPKGLSAAVLAQLPAQYGMPHAHEFSTIVFAAIITSVLISILTVYLTEKGIYHGLSGAFDAIENKFRQHA